MKIIKLLKGLIKQFIPEQPAPKKIRQPSIIPRNEHALSRKNIHPNALKVLYRLHEAGFGAYLVGGCVRDLLLGHRPKDFDIATDAHPEQVRRLFRNCRLIGKRFRLAHILFGRDIIEVATFRTHHQNANEQHARSHQGMIVRDNVYGDIEDDVERRDFTANALYYNIADFSLVDYVNGIDDIKNRVLRMIGDPEKRFHEDPVRLLRCVRFAGKLNFTISPEIETHLSHLSYLLQQVSSARLFQEILKFFQGSRQLAIFNLLLKYNLLEKLFSQTAGSLHHGKGLKLIELALSKTEQRLDIEKTVSPTFLFSVFLWQPIQEQAEKEEESGMPLYVAVEKAIFHVLKKQVQQLAIPRTLQLSIRDICTLQYRFIQRNGSRPHRTLEHPRFRAAYDLLTLRSEAGEHVTELCTWWTQFHEADPATRERLIKELNQSRPPKKRRNSRRKYSAKIPSRLNEKTFPTE